MSLIQKYIWVIKTIHRSGRITLKELNEKWRQNVDLSRGENLPRQTFDRWKGGILDMFGIVIDCEQRGRYHYYIANPEVLSEGELRTWLLDTYGTAETLSSSISIHDRILTEDIPSSQDFLATILEAMKSNIVLQITFHSFTMKEAKTFLVEPYCVKMSAQRWYMLARNVDYNYLRLYFNPAKRNVLDLKNETCKNREKRNVLKISHTRHFKTTKKQSKTGCFYSF